jgi:hypothetical protein
MTVRLMDHVREDFDRRMAVRRKMLTHLGIDVPEDRADHHRPALRATLLACAGCQNPAVCEFWIANARPGTPLFCGARPAFDDLRADD